MDSITRFPAQMTATHPVVLLQMPDRRFNRLPTLEQLELFFVQPLRLSEVQSIADAWLSDYNEYRLHE